jgi:phosphoribosylaminoimidazole-succinocarboxamide synthase
VKTQQIFAEGKTKKLYTLEQGDQLLMEFSDILPLNDSKKHSFKGKKNINTDISAYIFEYLASYNVPTHYIKKSDDKSIIVKKLNMIPFTLKIWNVATDILAKRLGLKDGSVLETPVLELYLKNAKLKDPLINDYHAYALNLCDRNDMNTVNRIGAKVNAVLRSFFLRNNIYLVSFSLEFGKYGNQVLLGDEISPDTFIAWEQLEDGKLDKKALTYTAHSAKEIYNKIHDYLLK